MPPHPPSIGRIEFSIEEYRARLQQAYLQGIHDMASDLQRLLTTCWRCGAPGCMWADEEVVCATCGTTKHQE